MALSLEQDGQQLLDDTDSAASRGGGRFRVASIVSTLTALVGYLLAEVVCFTYSCRGRLPRIMQT